ncbi:hypothetical protein KAR91_12375 [Candidatus Pacearchaeota archaeon]|nr:hypothetical protein [Candidatus Pacearchaeota archaeon]
MKLYEIELIENGFVVHYTKFIEESSGIKDHPATRKVWRERFYKEFKDAIDFILKYQESIRSEQR